MAVPLMEPTWALIRRPPGYPTTREPGKLEMIWDTNYSNLYQRLSPYSNYKDTLIGGFTTEPYYWISPLTAGKGLSGLKMAEAKYDSRLFPLGSAPIDVIRVSKFLGSGRGIPFLAKQFLLQTGNPYNETRIYNPTSPIIAAGMGLGLGSIRPQRFIDTSGGLFGIASSLIGPSIPSLFGAPKVDPPSGTTGLKALADPMKPIGGKGLIRAGTAERAESHLLAAWPATTGGAGGFGGFGKAVVGMVKSLFQNFIPQNQDGKEFRSDEGTYGLMLAAGRSKFVYLDEDGSTMSFAQRWWAGGKIMRKDGQVNPKPSRLFNTFPSTLGPVTTLEKDFSSGLQGSIPDVGDVGYSATINPESTKPGQRYGDSVGVEAMESGEEYTNSDVMYQFKYYTEQGFPTKAPDQGKDDVNKINFTLKKTIEAIKVSGVYSYTGGDTPILRDGSGTYDYNRLMKTNERTRGKPSALNYPLGVLAAYRQAGESVMVDASISEMPAEMSVKLPTNGTFDALNTLEVLDKDKSIKSSKLKGWTKWSPYDDDLVALYFYDIVNEKYIPFRASIKGLNEASNASWEEIPFIGRADRVYSYGGFTRTLTFNLKIVISSISELIPTWQRVNYILTSTKPANYTKSTYQNVTDRFAVPPMFMLTIGDMYRDQPVLMQAVTITIPDDAAWETANIDNGSSEWSYLSKMIKATGVLTGQLPREVELGFSFYLLEKERAIVGGANFGHAPRNEQWDDWNTDTIPNGGEPNDMHKKFVVAAKNLPQL